jgi:ATP-dependent DNA ligase
MNAADSNLESRRLHCSKVAPIKAVELRRASRPTSAGEIGCGISTSRARQGIRAWSHSHRAPPWRPKTINSSYGPAQGAAAFVEPMLLLRKERLPEGADWLYEIKLDGYRALAIKTGGKVQLRSRNDNDFNQRYPGIVKALATLPAETVIDGEIVALDEAGKPSFNTLQNYGSSAAPVFYFVFDLLVLAGRDVRGYRLRPAVHCWRSESYQDSPIPFVIPPNYVRTSLTSFTR